MAPSFLLLLGARSCLLRVMAPSFPLRLGVRSCRLGRLRAVSFGRRLPVRVSLLARLDPLSQASLAPIPHPDPGLSPWASALSRSARPRAPIKLPPARLAPFLLVHPRLAVLLARRRFPSCS
jgi:hypothetical protein